MKRWLNHPEFLWSNMETWLRVDNTIRQINKSDPELKNEVWVNLARVKEHLQVIITNPELVENEVSDDNGYLSQKQMDKQDQKINIR